jgi:predicted nuclease of predicted toxin-antitoxin system
MRLLVNSCVARSVVRLLRETGLDTECVAEWPRDPGDREILRYTVEADRILITRDKDFGELIFRDGFPHNGVLRIAGEMTYAEQAARVLQALADQGAALEQRGLVTIEPDRVRLSRREPGH